MFGSKSVVGLDIGSAKVKAVQLRKTGKSLEIERFGVGDVYPGGDRTAVTASPFEAKLAAAKAALESGRITAKYSVSAISGESIIVRYIQLPDMPEAELKNALRWEAEEYIPFSIDEVNLDSVVLGPSATAGKLDVLLVSARKDLINEHVSIVRALGLTPLIVDVEGFAFLNAYEVAYSPKAGECVALVNIGAETTNINIYLNGQSRFSRDIAIAGNTFTNAVMQKSGLPFGKSEELKRAVGAPASDAKEEEKEQESSLISTIRGTVERITGGDLGDDSQDAIIQKTIGGTLLQLTSEIRRSVQFFENQGGGGTVQRVFLGGGSAKMPGLPAAMMAELEIPVEMLDPLRSIGVGRDVNRAVLDAHREQLAVGIGLALRKVVD